MTTPVLDPWDVSDRPRPERERRGPTAWTAVPIAALLGAFGPVIRQLSLGPSTRVAALALAGTAVVWAAAVLTLRGALGASTVQRWVAGFGLAACSVAAGALIVGEIGRAPVGLVFVAVAIATWAVVPEPAAAAIAVLVLSGVSWFRSGDNRVAVVLLVVAAVLAAVSALGPGRVVDRAVRRGGLWLGGALATLVVLIAAIPLLYLPGGVTRLVEWLRHPRRRWDRDESNWTPVPLPSGDEVRDARYPFAVADPAERRVRQAVGAVLVVAAAALLVVAFVRRDASPSGDPVAAPSTTTPSGESVEDRLARIESTPYSSRPAFAGVDFADDLQREEARVVLVPNTTGSYAPADASGRFVNVVDGRRVSLEGTCDCPVVDVWVVGGSEVFGLGQRDEHTIASELVRLGEQRGVAVRVQNLGVPGWTIAQETAAVRARLAAGERPDLIVVVDGYNDVMATLIASALYGPDPSRPAVLDPADSQRFIERGLGLGDAGGLEAVGDAAVAQYQRSQRELVDAASALDVPVVFFFQPDALTSPIQRGPVEDLYDGIVADAQLDDADQVLEYVSNALSPDVVNLRQLLVDEPSPVFADTVHTNEVGARRVAVAIDQRVGALLQERAGS